MKNRFTKTAVATGLELAGLLVAAAAVGIVRLWAGLLVLGAGMVLFGVALEWD